VSVAGAIPPDGRMTVRYRRTSDIEWTNALPLLHINPRWIARGAPIAPIDSFAGTIFDLVPGTSYDVELTLHVPNESPHSITSRAVTRALPPVAAAPTRIVKPGDSLKKAFSTLRPGDVLELADGVYDVKHLVLESSGTESDPIVIRGHSRTKVILHALAHRALTITNASHITLENMTIEGSGVDSQTAASSIGIAFWNGAIQENITVRGLDVRGVDRAIIASGTTRGTLVYDNDLRGNNHWTAEFVESSRTWNDDGIRLPGEGNCAFENTLYGFGDSFSVMNRVHSAGIYYYRNRIEMTGDDAFEADYGTRNLAFYDNYITNAATFLSLDPLWGGPLYAFRNIVVNTIRGPFKLNAKNSGFLIYNNTIVRSKSKTGWGWLQFNNGALTNWAYQNNVFVYRGNDQLLINQSHGNNPIDFTNNAWFPDGRVRWTSTGGSYRSLAEARAHLPPTTPVFGASTHRHEHDIALASEPFATPIVLGSDHLTEVTATTVPALRPDSPAHQAGTPLPNITDGYSGTAPDMGAIIAGRSIPNWGAKRP